MKFLVSLLVLLAATAAGVLYLKSQPGADGFGYFTTTDEIFQWAKDQNVNLQDKVVIVTGVGKEVVRTLAKLRARLYLVGRHKDICEPFAQRLADETHAVIECQYVDLSDLASVELWKHINLPIHMVLNMASAKGMAYTPTEDKLYEKQFATNHLGHYLLTTSLLPWLKQGAPSRVITVSSEAHKIADINYKDLFGNGTWYGKEGLSSQFGTWISYAQSKTANILFSVKLNEELKGYGKANSVNPGRLMHESKEQEEQRERRLKRGTLKVSESWWVQEIEKLKNIVYGKTAKQGAATIAYVAVAPEIDTLPGGQYFEDCNVSNNVASYATDPKSADKLWKKSKHLTYKYSKA